LKGFYFWIYVYLKCGAENTGQIAFNFSFWPLCWGSAERHQKWQNSEKITSAERVKGALTAAEGLRALCRRQKRQKRSDSGRRTQSALQAAEQRQKRQRRSDSGRARAEEAEAL
jgi:hypothetical protein